MPKDKKNNIGFKNTGEWNIGNNNSGNRNTGDNNSGYFNTGDNNSGDMNTGDNNSGDNNTGDWNIGNWNTGDLNTTKPKLRIFNKETDVKQEDIKFPDFFFFVLTEWIDEDRGYLKSYKYKQAWRNSWDKANEEDRKKCFALPNWDNELFKEISGIDVEKELNEKSGIEIIVDGNKTMISREVAKALHLIK